MHLLLKIVIKIKLFICVTCLESTKTSYIKLVTFILLIAISLLKCHFCKLLSVLEYAQSLSCIQLFETPWTVAHQSPLSMGLFWQEYWSGLQFPSPYYLYIFYKIETSISSISLTCLTFFPL